MNCSICNKDLLSTYKLLKHVQKEHSLDKNFKIHCPKCVSSFTSRYKFRVHLTNMHPIIHLKKVKNSTNFTLRKCSFCGVTNTEYLEQLKHIVNHASDNSELFK